MRSGIISSCQSAATSDSNVETGGSRGTIAPSPKLFAVGKLPEYFLVGNMSLKNAKCAVENSNF